MNKQQKQFQKTIKTKKRKARKAKHAKLFNIGNIRKRALLKMGWLQAKREKSQNVLEYRHMMFDKLRQELDIPDNVHYTLEQLIKMSNNKKTQPPV